MQTSFESCDTEFMAGDRTWEYTEAEDTSAGNYISSYGTEFGDANYTFISYFAVSDGCSETEVQNLDTTDFSDIFYLYDFNISFWIKSPVGWEGQFRILICDTGDCAYTSWYSNGYTAWRELSFQQNDFNDVPADMSKIDEIIITFRNYETGACNDGAMTKFANFTIKRRLDAPVRTAVYDSGVSPMQNVNVTYTNSTGGYAMSRMTDASGIAFDDAMIVNNTYAYSFVRAGYYTISNNMPVQRCSVEIGTIDTLNEYEAACSPFSTVNMYPIPNSTSSVNYTFYVYDFMNNPLPNATINLRRNAYPFIFTSIKTDANGKADVVLYSYSTYDVEVAQNSTILRELFTTLNTQNTNQTVRYYLTHYGCSDISSYSPQSFDLYYYVLDGESVTVPFRYQLENSDYIVGAEWRKDYMTFAYSYPSINITFTETGDFTITAYIKQSDCELGNSWDIHIRKRVLDSNIVNESSLQGQLPRYTKDSFIKSVGEIAIAVFSLVVLGVGYILWLRGGVS